MPILGSLLVSMFGGLVGFFTQWLTKKVAIGVAAVATFTALTLTLWSAIGAAMMTVVAVVPSDSALLIGLWVAWPDNAHTCIAATIAADTAIALYKWNTESLRILSTIT